MFSSRSSRSPPLAPGAVLIVPRLPVSAGFDAGVHGYKVRPQIVQSVILSAPTPLFIPRRASPYQALPAGRAPSEQFHAPSDRDTALCRLL
jgi:hypothetical protein